MKSNGNLERFVCYGIKGATQHINEVVWKLNVFFLFTPCNMFSYSMFSSCYRSRHNHNAIMKYYARFSIHLCLPKTIFILRTVLRTMNKKK